MLGSLRARSLRATPRLSTSSVLTFSSKAGWACLLLMVLRAGRACFFWGALIEVSNGSSTISPFSRALVNCLSLSSMSLQWSGTVPPLASMVSNSRRAAAIASVNHFLTLAAKTLAAALRFAVCHCQTYSQSRGNSLAIRDPTSPRYQEFPCASQRGSTESALPAALR